MNAEAIAFREFLEKSNDSERNRLRLEVEKMHRAEGEWLQVVVRMLDHVHALYQAALRSGQANVKQQVSQFQAACRDIARRRGLVPFEAQVDEAFDEKKHQLLDETATAPEGSIVGETLATGFTYQGKLLRRAVVNIKEGGEKGDMQENSEEEEEEDEAQDDLLAWRAGGGKAGPVDDEPTGGA